jgi:hypothetical protein
MDSKPLRRKRHYRPARGEIGNFVHAADGMPAAGC